MVVWPLSSWLPGLSLYNSYSNLHVLCPLHRKSKNKYIIVVGSLCCKGSCSVLRGGVVTFICQDCYFGIRLALLSPTFFPKITFSGKKFSEVFFSTRNIWANANPPLVNSLFSHFYNSSGSRGNHKHLCVNKYTSPADTSFPLSFLRLTPISQINCVKMGCTLIRKKHKNEING